jgi:RND superfamily putative drug exporter
MYRAVRRAPYAVIVIVLVIALVMVPFAARINKAVNTSETSLLPKNVESIEVMNIVDSSTNASRQTNVIYIISGVPVNATTFYRLNSTLVNVLDKHNASNAISWIGVLNSAYYVILNRSGYMLNSSLELANGIKGMWEGVENLSAKLSGLQGGIFRLSQLLRNADYVYSNYYAMGSNLSVTMAGARQQLTELGNATAGLSNYYAALYFNVMRTEFLLQNATSAYETHNLTPADIEVVIESSPQIDNISSPTPQLVEFVYYSVLSSGGPGSFDNVLASNLTYELLSRELNGTSSMTALLNLYRAAFNNVSSRYPDLIYVLYRSPGIQGQYQLLGYVVNISRGAAELTFVDAVRGQVTSQRELELLLPVAYAYASSGFNSSALVAAMYNVTAEALASYRVPEPVAENLSYYIVSGSLSREVAAVDAVKTLLLYAPEGALANYSQVLRGLPEVLLEYDPSADGSLYSNSTYANVVASGVLGPALNVTDRQVLLELAENRSPTSVAVQVINGTLNSTVARELLNEVAMHEPIDSYGQLLSLMPSMLSDLLGRYGLPSNLTGLVVNSTMNVLTGTSSYSTQLSYVSGRLLNDSINNITDKVVGTLVQNDREGLLIMVPNNLSYAEVKGLEGDLSSALAALGYSDAKVMATGDQVLNYELSNSSMRSISESDTISTVLILVILAIVLESLVAVLLPFTGIGLGLVIALGTAYLLARGDVITLNSISRTIMYEAGLGLGVDYSTLISRRFREEFQRLRDSRAAAEAALRRSWRAVLSGGLTAAIGFGAMSIAHNFPFLASLGEAIPIAILITMTVSLTVIPALLAMVGGSRVVWWPSRLVKANGNSSRPAGRRYEGLVRRGAVALAIVVVLLVPAAYVYATFRGSYDFTLMMPQSAQGVTALHYITNNYKAGLMYPDYVVAPNVTTLEQINQSISRLSCVASTQLLNSSKPILEVTLSVYPLGRQAIACTEAIRGAAKSVSPQAMVGGMPAINLDLKNLVYHDFYDLVYPIAIVLMFVVLAAFYESIPMALTALASVVFSAIFGTALTVTAYEAMGITLPWYLPIVVFTAILGVGMDYNSFMVNRMREECERSCGREAVLNAMGSTSVLVVGLSVIMTGAFSGLLTFSAPGFRGMGLALMFGVLLAGLMASLLFTPLVVALMGRYAWWPKRMRSSGQ